MYTESDVQSGIIAYQAPSGDYVWCSMEDSAYVKSELAKIEKEHPDYIAIKFSANGDDIKDVSNRLRKAISNPVFRELDAKDQKKNIEDCF